MKNDIGKIISGSVTYRSKLISPYIHGVHYTHILSDIPGVHFTHILSEQAVHFFNDLTSDVAPIIGTTNRVMINLDPTRWRGGGLLAGKRAPASARHHHRPRRGSFAPAIPRSPQLQPRRNLSNISVLQDIDTRSASSMAFAGLVHMITSSRSARARVVRPNDSPLPPPLSSHHKHARAHEPAEPRARTALPPPHLVRRG